MIDGEPDGELIVYPHDELRQCTAFGQPAADRSCDMFEVDQAWRTSCKCNDYDHNLVNMKEEDIVMCA